MRTLDLSPRGSLRKSSRSTHSSQSKLGRFQRLNVEQLEARRMLAITVSAFDAITGELSIVVDSADDLTIASVGGNVQINGANPLLPGGPIAANSVVSLSVVGLGLFDNTLDLSGVTDAAFSALDDIDIDLGLGNDQVVLGGTITLNGPVDYNAPVLLTADTVINAGANDVTFSSTVDGPFSLTVNTTGDTEFDGVVGGLAPLTGLITNAGGTTTIGGDLVTVTLGGINIGDALVLTDDLVLTSGGDITLGGTVDTAVGLAVGDGDLTLNALGATVIVGNVGSNPLPGVTDPLLGSGIGASLVINSAGPTTVQGTIDAAGALVQVNAAGLLELQGDVDIGVGDGTPTTLLGNVILDGITLAVDGNVTIGNALTDSLSTTGATVVIDTRGSTLPGLGLIDLGGTITIGTPIIVIQIGAPVDVTGSNADDNFVLNYMTPTDYTITLNGTTTAYTVAANPEVDYDAGLGNDTSTVIGSTLAETNAMSPLTVHFNANNNSYLADIANSETNYVFGGANDVSNFVDSAGDDNFYGVPTYAVITNAASNPNAYLNEAIGFPVVNIDATTGLDFAYHYDSAGNETYNATATASNLVSANYQLNSTDFDASFAVFYGGGNDTANFTGNPTTDNYVFGDASDTANFFDTAGDDTFYGVTNFSYSVMANASYFNEVVNVGTVNATASQGGNDIAYIYDTSGNDTYNAGATNNSIVGAVSNTATGFDMAFGVLIYGGVDTANISANPATINYVFGVGGNDTANFFDSTGDDTFYGQLDYSIMVGANYFSEATGMATVVANASSGTDAALLYDSPGNDSLTASGSSATVTRPTSSVRANNFDKVTAFGSTGNDTSSIEATDFTLETVGNWN